MELNRTQTNRNNLTASATGAYTQTFVQNNLPSSQYETIPLGKGVIPNYTGHTPGTYNVVGQRAAAASLHSRNYQATAPRTPVWTDISLVDLRPEQRSLNKVYMYSEFCPSNFMKFPDEKSLDHRRL